MLAFFSGLRNRSGKDLARMEMLEHVAMLAERLRLDAANGRRSKFDLGVNLPIRHGIVMTRKMRIGW